ncbi:MAG: hypothetical protein EOO86_05855 [Pedobacter sp.]|nr:MAG: hypothetical protein EOO86_05855 [Pedobacter sp.]
MKIILALFITLITFTAANAQDINTTLYSGTVNNRSVRLYLKERGNQCGGSMLPIYESIYQYGKGKNWIELSVATNGKGNFCLTEYYFSGVMILQKSGKNLNGIWISPDGKTQLKVILEKQILSVKEKEIIENDLERTHYENYDC